MGDVLQFTNPPWVRLPPIHPQGSDITHVIVYNFLDWKLPIPDQLSIFERKWIENIKGYGNRESYEYLNETRDSWDTQIAMKLYGSCALPQNVRGHSVWVMGKRWTATRYS